MHVELIALDPAAAARAAQGDLSVVPAANIAAVAALVQQVAVAYRDLYRRTAAQAPWLGYLARDPSTGELVGSCGFKDCCRRGIVEIAYFTFPKMQGRGWGSRMAGALVAMAWAQPAVERIRAHTRPEESASTRILRRLAFGPIGEVHDIEDGQVWLWELSHPTRCA